MYTLEITLHMDIKNHNDPYYHSYVHTFTIQNVSDEDVEIFGAAYRRLPGFLSLTTSKNKS